MNIINFQITWYEYADEIYCVNSRSVLNYCGNANTTIQQQYSVIMTDNNRNTLYAISG